MFFYGEAWQNTNLRLTYTQKNATQKGGIFYISLKAAITTAVPDFRVRGTFYRLLLVYPTPMLLMWWHQARLVCLAETTLPFMRNTAEGVLVALDFTEITLRKLPS